MPDDRLRAHARLGRGRARARRRHARDREAPAGRAGHRDDDRRDAAGGDARCSRRSGRWGRTSSCRSTSPSRRAATTAPSWSAGASSRRCGARQAGRVPLEPAPRRPRRARRARPQRYRSAAIRATKVMGLEVAGVDMLEGEDGPKILEINSSPGLEGIERASGVDVAGAIIAARREVPREAQDSKEAAKRPRHRGRAPAAPPEEESPRPRTARSERRAPRRPEGDLGELRLPSSFPVSLLPSLFSRLSSFVFRARGRVAPGACAPGAPSEPYLEISTVRLFRETGLRLCAPDSDTNLGLEGAGRSREVSKSTASM